MNESKVIEGNKLFALFIGMQQTSLGWFDNEEALHLPYTKDNTFDELLFHSSWDWLMPVIGKLSNEWEEPEELDDIKYAVLTNNIEEAYICVAYLIENK